MYRQNYSKSKKKKIVKKKNNKEEYKKYLLMLFFLILLLLTILIINFNLVGKSDEIISDSSVCSVFISNQQINLSQNTLDVIVSYNKEMDINLSPNINIGNAQFNITNEYWYDNYKYYYLLEFDEGIEEQEEIIISGAKDLQGNEQQPSNLYNLQDVNAFEPIDGFINNTNIIIDTKKPQIISAQIIGENKIKLIFDEEINLINESNILNLEYISSIDVVENNNIVLFADVNNLENNFNILEDTVEDQYYNNNETHQTNYVFAPYIKEFELQYGSNKGIIKFNQEVYSNQNQTGNLTNNDFEIYLLDTQKNIKKLEHIEGSEFVYFSFNFVVTSENINNISLEVIGSVYNSENIIISNYNLISKPQNTRDSIPLYSGWNLISVPYNLDSDWTISNNISSNQAYSLEYNNGWVATNTITPGKAVFINVTTPQELFFDFVTLRTNYLDFNQMSEGWNLISPTFNYSEDNLNISLLDEFSNYNILSPIFLVSPSYNILTWQATITNESIADRNFYAYEGYWLNLGEDGSTVEPVIDNNYTDVPINGEIWYLEHLAYINTNYATKGADYKLMRNLDFNNNDSYYNINNKSIWTQGSGWTPIGTISNRFRGTFDGQEYTIKNLYINRPQTNNVGLFGYTDVGSDIKNLGLQEVNVFGNRFVGALIGYNNGSIVNNTYSTGNVSGTSHYVGGLIGRNNTLVSNSHSEAYVTGNGYVGGLIGYNTGEQGIVEESYSAGDVSATGYYIGGIVGYNNIDAKIKNSYFSGFVSSPGYYIGGITGYNRSIVKESYSDGYIIGSESVGGLVGFNHSDGTINDSYFSGIVLGHSRVGGVAGRNYTTIEDSYFNGFILGYRDLGGIVGYNLTNGYIKNCYSKGSISGTSNYIGGITGYNSGDSAAIENSYSSSLIYGQSYLGGLAGFNYNGAIIKNSYSLGNTQGRGSYIGGLIGYNHRLDAEIENSYSLGEVYGTSYVGGAIGYNVGATIKNVYSSGFVSGISSYVSGFVGRNLNHTVSDQLYLGLVEDGYWDLEKSTRPSSVGTSLTTLEMKDPENFVNWDFDNVWGSKDEIPYIYLKDNEQTTQEPNKSIGVVPVPLPGKRAVFSLDVELHSFGDNIYYTIDGSDPSCDGDGLLYSNPINISTGTTTIKAIGCKNNYNNTVFTFKYILPEPKYISTAHDLHNIRNDLLGIYILTNDIDLDISPFNIDNGWEPIGSSASPFFGYLDGQNYKIKNLYINRASTSYTGLFSYTGHIQHISTIKDLGLEDVDVYGNSFVGALSGYNFGDIYNIYATGTVSGQNNYVGGLTGYNRRPTTHNHFIGDVIAGNYVGGLFGYNYSIVSNSYSKGNVSGRSYVGGLFGYTRENVSKSYSNSDVFSTGNFVGSFAGYSLSNISDSYSTGNVTRLLESTQDTNYGGFIGYYHSNTIKNCYSIGSIIYEDGNNPTDKGFSSNNINLWEGNFWNVTTSSQTTSPTGAMGKTLIEMKQQQTFTSFDWDFNNVWQIQEGETYPYLRDNSQFPTPK